MLPDWVVGSLGSEKFACCARAVELANSSPSAAAPARTIHLCTFDPPQLRERGGHRKWHRLQRKLRRRTLMAPTTEEVVSRLPGQPQPSPYSLQRRGHSSLNAPGSFS